MSNAELTDKIKKKATSLGFNMVGVVPAVPSRRLAAYHSWLANKYHGEMGWMARPDRIIRREDLSIILPVIQSIIVVGLNYWSGQLPVRIASDPSRGRISNYSWGVDYHKLMEPRLRTLSAWIEGNTSTEVQSKVYVDTGAILERDHGESAALGFPGKNTMLINPKMGSWFFLGELLTTVELIYDDLDANMPGCGTCSRCLTACPTAAFPKAYMLDARRCISYLTIELKGWIPRELRPLMGNWIYGCDVCQDVCPFNRFSEDSQEKSFYAEDWDRAAPRLLDMLALDDDGFIDRFKGTPVERIGRERLVRNSCVAVGNWGSDEVLPYLAKLLADPVPVVRGHAAWALGRIRGKQASQALKDALDRENDKRVASELKMALVNNKYVGNSRF